MRHMTKSHPDAAARMRSQFAVLESLRGKRPREEDQESEDGLDPKAARSSGL